MTSRVLYIDAFAGIAGDMLTAALIDLGAPLDQIRDGLLALPLRGYALEAVATTRGPFAATRFIVSPVEAPASALRPAAPALPEQDDGHSHSHGHGHSHSHAHRHDHGHAHIQLDPWPDQPHRDWREIREMIAQSALPGRVRQRALATFSRLAAAEARVHGVPVEEVAFHEVGAVDSIVDIVGACLAMELLQIDRLVSGPLPMGSGMIHTAHGATPLPAPATLQVLVGFPVVPGPPGREHVTPTGAALVAALAEPGPMPAMTVLGVGHGAGTRDPADLPNVVRVVLGAERVADSPTRVVVIEAQMDDLSGEHLPPLLEALLEAGALDAYATHTLMKKGRPGLLVSALATPPLADAVTRALLRHGSTFGARRYSTERQVLDRAHVAVETPWGSVRVKTGRLDGALVHASPEHEDVAALARSAGVPVPVVHAAALRAYDGAVTEDP